MGEVAELDSIFAVTITGKINSKRLFKNRDDI